MTISPPARLTKKISAYCADELSLPAGQPYELYKKYGTCLRGLMEVNTFE